MVLTRSFLRGLTETVYCDVTIIDVIKQDIRPCLGCFACWKNGNGKCVQRDDQNEILDRYVDANVIIWSFPLYCYSMPSHIKAVLDRTIPLVQLRMKETDGKVQHESLIDFSQKHNVVICGCGFPAWEGNFDGLKLQCRNSFGNLTMVCVPETPLLNVPEAKSVADPLIEKFQQAGCEYATGKKLHPETIAALEREMLPREEYLKEVNECC